MTAEPSTPELTPEEMVELSHRMYTPPPGGGNSLANRLLKVQGVIVDTLNNSEFAKHYFRILYPRKDVKTFDRIVEKINTKRRDGEPYDINSLDDLIGAQMLCPYPDDVKRVLDWLYDEKGGRKFFQVVTPKKNAEEERKEREKKTGYRAYHICLRLNDDIVQARNLPSDSGTHKFELQIKTLLEAAWDGKTHDVTYKERDIEPALLEHMQLISHSLTAIDEQTKLLRYQIEEEKKARNDLRRAATLLLFYITLTNDERTKLGIKNKNIDEWQQEDVNRLEKGLEKYRKNKGIDTTFCFGLGLLALYTEKTDKREKALSYSSLLVKQAEKETLHKALRTRAGLRWAFQHIQHSLNDLDYCIKHFNDESTIGDKNDFVYYICDLYKPSDAGLNQARLFLKELESNLNSDEEIPWEIIDTISRFYICFSKTEDDFNKGLMYAQKSNNIKKTDEEKKVSDALKKYHDYLTIKQRARIQRGI